MSNPCKIPECLRASVARCNCCEKNICLFHINEHSELLVTQLNPLSVEIDAVDNELQAFDTKQSTIESHEKLEQWRTEYHQRIEQFYEKKCAELDQCILNKTSKQTKQITLLRAQIEHFKTPQGEITRQDVNLLTSSVSQLKKEMRNIQQTYIQIQSRSYPILDTMIQITESLIPKIDLTTLPPPCKSINHPKNTYPVLISNNTSLLIHQGDNLCLVNQNMNIVREIEWPFHEIVDMCWSAKLNQFIVIDDQHLYLVDETVTSIDEIQIRRDSKWFACTCSDTSLYLSTSESGSSLNEFQLVPKIEFVKKWSSPVTCKKTEQIDCIVYNNGTIALLITNFSDKSVRIELRFAIALELIWALPLDIKCTKQIVFHCCALNFDEWLVANHENNHLIHIAKPGLVKSTIRYPAIPYRINLFHQNVLVVLTQTCKAFHQLF